MIVTGRVYNDQLGFMENVNVSHVLPVKNGVYPIVKTVQTDAFGAFKIDVPSTSSILHFSHVGFDFDTITVAAFNAQAVKQIQLYASTEVLPDVNVGTNTTKQKDNTGLIALIIFGVVAAIAFTIGKKDDNKRVKARA